MVLIGLGVGYFLRKNIAEGKLNQAEQEAARIIANGERTAESKKKEALLEAKEEIHKLRSDVERENKDRRSELQRMERRILQKEESNSRKLLDYIALQNGVKLIPKMEVVSQELITEFVNIGLGIGFSIIDLATRNYKNLKELKINRKVPNINIYLATNKSISLTFASKMFIKYLKA